MLFLTGCSFKVEIKGGIDGGVFKTEDSGDNWIQTTQVYSASDIQKNFNGSDLTAMVLDPTDRKAMYIGTETDGIYYTYNGAEGWMQALKNLGKVNSIAVSPKERCTIYVAIDNKIYKTTDCSRNWNYQLIEARENPKNKINSIAIDYFNTAVIYAGTSGNGLFASYDYGFSWKALKFFDDIIVKIAVSPKNSKIIYVATERQGIFKTSNAGETWRQILTAKMQEQKPNLLIYRDFIIDPTVEDGIMYASQNGILRSKNGGEGWEDIKLLTPPSTTAIYSLAINPQNGQEFYYGINNALYHTVDGGKNWITRSLPSIRAACFLELDPVNTNIIYLGVKKIN